MHVPEFKLGNRFEFDNIFQPVLCGDEYRLGPSRLKPEDVVIDIGAHIGSFALLCHQKGSRAIYCFEPSRRNFILLQLNVGSLEGLHLSRTAVWRSDCADRSELTLSGAAGENTGSHCVLAGGLAIDIPAQGLCGEPGEATRVSATPLDRILERFDTVKLLKFDCEGSEFPILLTSRRLDRVERLVGEVHEIHQDLIEHLNPDARLTGYLSYRLQDLIARLESAGFSVQARSAATNMFIVDARRRAGKTN